MYARAGAGPPPTLTFFRRRRERGRLLLGHADAADGAAGARDLERRGHGLPVADALEHRVGALAAGELPYALDRLVAALADDVGGAELARRARPGRGGGPGG